MALIFLNHLQRVRRVIGTLASPWEVSPLAWGERCLVRQRLGPTLPQDAQRQPPQYYRSITLNLFDTLPSTLFVYSNPEVRPWHC